MGTKTKTKTATKVVKGPQLALPVKGARTRKPLGKAKGKEPPRTARVRYIEPPTKKDGQPFFAARVPSELLAAFKRHAAKVKATPQGLVREYMAKVTGVDVGGDDE